MPNRLTSKVAVITGTSSGIGRAIALAYHREGAFIVCSDIREGSRNEHSGETDVSTHEVILKDEGKAIFVKADTSKAEEVETLIKRAVEEFGRVDMYVNLNTFNHQHKSQLQGGREHLFFGFLERVEDYG